MSNKELIAKMTEQVQIFGYLTGKQSDKVLAAFKQAYKEIEGAHHDITQQMKINNDLVAENEQLHKDITELVGALDCAYKLLEPFDDPGISLGLGSEALKPIKQALAKHNRES